MSLSPARLRMRRRMLLALGSTLLSLLAGEGLLRLCVERSPASYGRLFGHELPPHRVVPSSYRPDPEADRQVRKIVGGLEVTRGDIEGVMREDPVLGFAPREQSASARGWWQTNSLGARRRADPGSSWHGKRVLLFGDSYAQGHGLRQAETLGALLDSQRGLEVLNFGVSGYGVGQAFLRYQGLPDDLAADTTMLLLVPSADLWREVNTLRSLAGWESYVVVPRFSLEAGSLRRVESPYADLAEMLRENRHGLAPRLRDHLRAYDRLYTPWRHENHLVSRWSIISKLVQGHFAPVLEFDAPALLAPGSEAMEVTMALVSAFRHAVEARGQAFVVAVLPVITDVAAYADDPAFARLWDVTLDAVRARAHTLDLMPVVSPGPLDVAYDLSHYGPKVQRRLAAALVPELTRTAPSPR